MLENVKSTTALNALYQGCSHENKNNIIYKNKMTNSLGK